MLGIENSGCSSSHHGSTTSSYYEGVSLYDPADTYHHSHGNGDSDEDEDGEEMSVKEKERLTTIAKSMTEALLEATDLLGGIPWALVHEKHGISLFRADVGNNVPCNVHAVCKFACDMDDVAESMITSTTESYKTMMRMLSSDFLDGAVIQNIVEPSELNPHRYVALKWAAFKSSSPFTKDRDFIILEYVDMIEDDQGQKIAFRIMESVDVPNNSRFAESPRYTRDIVPLMGFMYHSTKKPGELRMTYTCNFDKNGDLPAWAANSAIQSHVEKCINGILKYIENFRAKKESIVLPQQVIPMSEQDHCRICEKNFCLLRRRYNCLKCGEVICSNCSSMRTAHVPQVGERQLRVCTACVLESRRCSRMPESPSRAKLAANLASGRGGFKINTGTTLSSVGSSVAEINSKVKSATPTSRSQGQYSNQKRRSYDDLLEPVRSRLIEYKTFSCNPEALGIPKASFPGRSFSDGLIMRKESLFGTKRRGSPADLAISIEAFRQHQIRMGNASDPQPEDSETTTEEDSLRQFEYFSSTSSVSSTSSTLTPGPFPSQTDEIPALTALCTTNSVLDGGNARSLKGLTHETTAIMATTAASRECYQAMQCADTKSQFAEAMERAEDIIMRAKYANNLAQHARKLSHHRIIALQREHQDMSPLLSNNQQNGQTDSNNQSRYELCQSSPRAPALCAQNDQPELPDSINCQSTKSNQSQQSARKLDSPHRY